MPIATFSLVHAGRANSRRRTSARFVFTTIFVAEQHLRGGRKEEARSALNGLDWEREDCPSWNLWRAAEIYDSLGDFEKTAFLLARSEEDGHRPYYRLAELAVRKEDWVEATRQIIKERIPTKVLVLSSYSDDAYVHQLTEAGAAGYLIKQTAANDLILAGPGADTISGAGGDDCILGGGGADMLLGDSGTDTCIGGAETDILDITCETWQQ